MFEMEWLEGLDFIFQSDVTHQMILSLNDFERSYFICNFIGCPEDYKSEICETLVQNLTCKPYAGSFMIYLVENFDESSDF